VVTYSSVARMSTGGRGRGDRGAGRGRGDAGPNRSATPDSRGVKRPGSDLGSGASKN
jgi:hypothetical protein